MELSSAVSGERLFGAGWRGAGMFGLSSPSASTGLTTAPCAQRLAAGSMPHMVPPPVSTGIARTIMAVLRPPPKGLC